MASRRPTLALVQPGETLRRTVEAAFGQVWSGRRVVSSVSATPGLNPRLAVVASERAGEAFSVARSLARIAPDVPILAVVEGAAQLRKSGHVPRQVVWATSPEELDSEYLKMLVRFVLESHDHRTAEAANRELRARDMGWLLRHVSHEISNPLTTLVANLEFVLSQIPRSAVSSDVLSALYDARIAATHITSLAEDLRRVSPRATGLVRVDVSDIINTARRLCGHLSGVAVHVRAAPSPPVRINETRLVQVLLNLLQNAGRALEGVERPEVTIDVSSQDDTVSVRVGNNGPPIADDVVPKLFVPGFTTHRDGSGIGLALSRSYIREMGGQLRLVQHSPTVCFELLLPAARKPSVPATLVPVRGGQGGRVLLVDDEPAVRRAIRRGLSTTYEVDEAGSVEEAIRYTTMARYHLLLVDLHLGGESGLDVHRALLRHHGRMPGLVFLSGHFSEADLAYIEQHRLHYATKPVGLSSLEELIAERIAAQRTGS